MGPSGRAAAGFPPLLPHGTTSSKCRLGPGARRSSRGDASFIDGPMSGHPAGRVTAYPVVCPPRFSLRCGGYGDHGNRTAHGQEPLIDATFVNARGGSVCRSIPSLFWYLVNSCNGCWRVQGKQDIYRPKFPLMKQSATDQLCHSKKTVSPHGR